MRRFNRVGGLHTHDPRPFLDGRLRTHVHLETKGPDPVQQESQTGHPVIPSPWEGDRKKWAVGGRVKGTVVLTLRRVGRNGDTQGDGLRVKGYFDEPTTDRRNSLVRPCEVLFLVDGGVLPGVRSDDEDKGQTPKTLPSWSRQDDGLLRDPTRHGPPKILGTGRPTPSNTGPMVVLECVDRGPLTV